MFRFLVNAPGHTDQGWWCRALQWGCDGGADLSRHVPVAPEITDANILAVVVVALVLCVSWLVKGANDE